MPTPNSASTSYCSPADALLMHDARQWGDKFNDDDTRVSPAGLLTNTAMQACLDRASGEIEAACFVAQKYSPEDLSSLTGVGLRMLKGLCAELAFWYAEVRRHPNAEMPTATQWAFETLQNIRKGDLVFGLVEQQEAGLPVTEFTTQDQINTLNLTTTISRRYFGERSKERRITP